MHKKEKKDLFIQNYLASMGKVSKACLATKVARSTYYNWMTPTEKEYDKDFREAIILADLSFCERVEDEVWKKIQSGSDLWMWRYLRSHCPEKWKADGADNEQVLHSGTIKLEIERKIV